MKVLFLGSDRTFFKDSPARRRAALYGAIFDEIHFVVFTEQGFKSEAIAPNVFLHPTNSFSRWLRPLSAFRIAYQLLRRTPGAFMVSAEDAFEIGFVGYLLKMISGERLQLQVHTDFLSPYFGKERWENRIRALVARFLLPRADCIRVVSQRIRVGIMAALDLPPEKISVLPVWQERPNVVQTVGQSPEMLRILVVSRLELEKGVDDAIRAFASFLKQGGVGRLTIVGTGSQRPALEQLARDLQLSDKVTFKGWQNDLNPYFSDTDVYFLPSHYEGWGMAAFAAACLGIPVLATDVGLAGEVVKDGSKGIIVPVGAVDRMAEALLLLHQKAEYLLKLSREPLEFDTLTRDEYLRQYRTCMEQCVSAGQRN